MSFFKRLRKNRNVQINYANINCMNLIDLIEMFVDWKSATLRHENGDLKRSIEINTKRFNLSKQLKSIFMNTVKILED